MKNELTPTGAIPPQEVTDADIMAAQVKLWEFLGRRTRSYTMGDSSSVRVETAQELFASACYILRIDLNGSPSVLRSILDWDLDRRFAEGITTVERKIQTAQRLWQAACLSVPQMENISLSATLRSIGSFPKRYHYRYFAHEIPCDIDYQLCHPVPETLLGVDYIIEYLRRILIEHGFLRCFEPALCIGLLDAYCPDYKGLLINLYEPIATNAIGVALIDSDTLKLDISSQERVRIATILDPLPKSQAINTLQSAASAVCTALKIHQPVARQYLRRLAEGLYPRIHAALSAGNLDGVFLSCK